MKFFTQRLLLLLCIVANTLSVRAQDEQGGFQKENKNIKQDAANIKSDKDRIAYWQFKLEKDLKYNRVLVATASRQELEKAKSDLKRDLEYLETDVSYLKKSYRLALQLNQSQLKDLVATIKSLNKKIKQATKQEDEAAIEYYAVQRDARENEIQVSEQELENLEISQVDNLAMVEELLKDTENYIGAAVTYMAIHPDRTAELDR